jgi:transcriptional antiterminator NusG
MDSHSEKRDQGQFSWYVVHVASGSEDKTSLEIKERIERAGYEDALKSVSVPRRKAWAVRRGERVEVDEVVFPGYVLMEIRVDPGIVALIQKIPRVMSVLGVDDANDTVRSISAQDMEAMHSALSESKEAARTSASFEEGEVVRIKEGLFESMEGDVEYVDTQKMKLKVSVPILGRPTPVELDFSQVEKVVS